MSKPIGIIIFVTLIGFGLIDASPPKDATTDQLLSLVRSFYILDSKLERHENRERALGEIIKKSLHSLQMGQRTMDPMKGIFTRLDERVSQIETLLMAQEQKYSQQTEKIDEIMKLLKRMDENSKKKLEINKEPVVIEAPMNTELIKEIHGLSANIGTLLATSSSLKQQTETISQQWPKTEDLIIKLENRLVSLYVPPTSTTPPPIVIDNSEFENKVMESIKNVETQIKELKTVPPPTPPSAVQVQSGLMQADKEFIQGLANETLIALETLKIETLGASEKGTAQMTSRIQDSEINVKNNVNQINEHVAETTHLLEKLYNQVNNSFGTLDNGLINFNKIMLSNSDEITQTQRKVEFATHQIAKKVTDIIEAQQSELSKLLNKRFDDVDESIDNNHMEALQNISATMENEITNVWRQVEIMNSEITESKDAMNKLTGQTEVYVNGTFTTMDGMEGKVSQITSRMMEVDSNLNYLLGRLGLITQEFNQIKSGLGDALEQIRGSFHEIRDKVANSGPGPHNIPRNEYETDFNLLSKRNAS